tara:strand:- start:823912 stop:825285 length:1374 start_codon:yes stop_codon:yes gene_type:complete
MHASLATLQPILTDAVMTHDAHFNHVSTDSRHLGNGDLFVALRGERFDAHDFLSELDASQVSAVITERIPDSFNVPALIVPDTRKALGEIAHYWRRQFGLPVIGVTGSNGKTTVKEMIAAILEAAFGEDQYLATRGNFNNEIGVPLTLMRLHADCKAAVIELGMNHPGEIAILSAIAEPSVGLVNNAQREHQEFMSSVEAVARENGAVLSHLPADGVAVFPADDPFTALWFECAASSGVRTMTFGLTEDADVHCRYKATDFGNALQVVIGDENFTLNLAAAGLHNVRNALAAIACTHAIGINTEAIVSGLQAFAPVNGRLQRKTAANGTMVIDDTYNANPDSVRAAIDVLAATTTRRILVLGDMGEVGNDGPQYHEEIGNYARDKGIQYVLAMGELSLHTVRAFGQDASHYDDVNMLCIALNSLLHANTTVLVKGSRFMQMERVVQHLLNQPIQGRH